MFWVEALNQRKHAKGNHDPWEQTCCSPWLRTLICRETCGGQVGDSCTADVDEVRLLRAISDVGIDVEAYLEHASGVAR